MASSSRGSEGADEGASEILEDLVLPWTRDATTMNTFGTFVENDQQLLEELIECVHKEKDAKATEEKLSVLLGRGKDRRSVVFRARVLSRLIAIALGLHPDDITIDSETGKESLRPSVDFQTTLRPRLVEALEDDTNVLSYLFKDALEADDEVMTVIFCDPRFFEKYSVPYFRGCDLAVVQEISKLWLSKEILRGFYYSTVLESLFNPVKVGGRASKMSEEIPEENRVENLLNDAMMLCELLQRRSVKAGARLLEVLLFRIYNSVITPPGDTILLVRVEELVILLLPLKSSKFRKCFLENFQNRGREVRWHSRDFDQLLARRHGQSITIGPSSAQTDSNLLCWAARRGYSNLIRCISSSYITAREMSPINNLLEDANEALAVSLLWKVALWCATRHGHDSVVMELVSPPWVKSIDFNDYTDIVLCLPPLHLVSLLGDRSLLRVLCMCKVGIETGAYKTDYLGKTPLDYAMQSQLTTKNSKEGVNIKERMQLQTPNYEVNEWSGVPRASRYYPIMGQQESSYERRQMPYPITRQQENSYETRPTQYRSAYSGGMLIPTLGHQSCIRQLLQMPGVVDRLKELNDMYTTQANFVLIGAALIASVAFVGWLQPPLGYTDYFQFTPPNPPAPAGTFEQYVAVEGHLSVHMFVAFNALSFFMSIGTMLIGAEATLFVHDNDERTIALMKVRKSIKWMLGFFITSMVCIMVAFICAGLAILPPIQRLEWSMIVSLCLGACICLIPLTWILFSLARDQIIKLKDQVVKLIMPFDEKNYFDKKKKLGDLHGSLVDGKDMKTFEKEKKRWIQLSAKPYSPRGTYSFTPNSPSGDGLYGDRLYGDRLYGDRLNGDRLYGDRLYGDRLYGDRQYGGKVEVPILDRPPIVVL